MHFMRVTTRSRTVNPNIFESLLFSEFTSINRLAPFKFSDQVINQQLIIIIIIVKHFRKLCASKVWLYRVLYV